MVDDDDDGPEDRPELLPTQRSAASSSEDRKRLDTKRKEWLEDQAFLREILATEPGRRFVWNILYSCGTFEERYGTINDFSVNSEATWSYRGQKDLGLRFYHMWSVQDRAGMLALLDQFLPNMPKEPEVPKRRRRRREEF